MPTQLLKDLLHVYQQPKEKDATEAHKKLRELHDKDYPKFLDRLQKVQLDNKVNLGKIAPVLQEVVRDRPQEDVGTEAALEALERWLENDAREHP